MALDPIAWLEANGAQRDVVDGLRECARDWGTLWRECPRGDWLLGIATRAGVDHVALVRAAIGCARTAMDLLDGDGEARAAGAAARALLEVATSWANGVATKDEVAAAVRALEPLAGALKDPSADAAARSAQAVGMGVADPDVLVSSAAFAAEATIVSTIDCGLAMAMGWAHGKCADAVRAAIAFELVERGVQQK